LYFYFLLLVRGACFHVVIGIMFPPWHIALSLSPFPFAFSRFVYGAIMFGTISVFCEFPYFAICIRAPYDQVFSGCPLGALLRLSPMFFLVRISFSFVWRIGIYDGDGRVRFITTYRVFDCSVDYSAHMRYVCCDSLMYYYVYSSF